ncbi:helix-turn-helix domain-containing protein [Streptomyces sp. NPDC001984]
MPPEPSQGPPPAPGDTVGLVVPPDVARELLRPVVLGLAARVRADGVPLSPRAVAFLTALHRTAEQAEPGFPTETPTAPAATVELGMGEVAALLECSPQYARRLAREGRLRARRAGRIWLVDPASLDAYRRGQPECPNNSPTSAHARTHA